MVKEFKINDNDKIMAYSQSTKNGFRHIVKYVRNGNVIQTRSVNYLNRTWERYTYETAINRLLEKMMEKNNLSLLEKKKILETIY